MDHFSNVGAIFFSKTLALPKPLKFRDVRLYAFAALFAALDVLVPWIFHQFHLAGPTFLPMHFFALLAGLTLGWRAGLLVGLSTPLISFGVSGMPISALLPQITFELIFYGLAAGILREKFNLRIIWALLGAMLTGRLALGIAVLLLYLGKAMPIPNVLSAIQQGSANIINPLTYLWLVIQQGWPGIITQLILIPPLARVLSNWWQKKLDA
jgi:hypothetical protein